MCEHDALSPEQIKNTKWLKKDSPAHKALGEVLLAPYLLKDIPLLTGFHHTGNDNNKMMNLQYFIVLIVGSGRAMLSNLIEN